MGKRKKLARGSMTVQGDSLNEAIKFLKRILVEEVKDQTPMSVVIHVLTGDAEGGPVMSTIAHTQPEHLKEHVGHFLAIAASAMLERAQAFGVEFDGFEKLTRDEDEPEVEELEVAPEPEDEEEPESEANAVVDDCMCEFCQARRKLELRMLSQTRDQAEDGKPN